MTFRERLKLEHPDFVDLECYGGCKGCPYGYNYELGHGLCEGGDFDDKMCTECWDREIPEEKPLVEGVAEVTKTWEEMKAELMPSGKDPVNHPGHYESGQFECIDVMLETQGKEAVMGFCICNAFKYLYRHKRKNGYEDVKKAVWYLNKYFELAEGDA